MRFAKGASISMMNRVVGFHYTLEDLQYNDDFIVLDLDDKFDVILGLPWLRRYEPRVSWQHRPVKMPATCLSDGHLMNVLERPQACGSTASECDSLTCGTVVSTTAQDHSVTTNYTVEEAFGGCADAQAAPKVYHSNKSSGSGHECTPRGRSVPIYDSDCTFAIAQCLKSEVASSRYCRGPLVLDIPPLTVSKDDRGSS